MDLLSGVFGEIEIHLQEDMNSYSSLIQRKTVNEFPSLTMKTYNKE